jgi:isoamylase
MDALRYWTQEMHVDGFRFDLATALGRGTNDFDPIGAFLQAVGQDPVLAGVKLIAEPWDVGAGGDGAGDFPAGWSEWNGRYRDAVRDFWRGQDAMLPEFATRVADSADLYGHGGRRPTASINIVTVHDGFTLADLVSYDAKHNAANGDDNRDGTDDNRSWNCGAEGPTDDPAILELRARQRRNLLATLLLSEGVPMLLAATSSAARRAATTTLTARTTRPAGSTGPPPRSRRRSSTSWRRYAGCAVATRPSAAGNSSAAPPSSPAAATT